MTLLADAFIPTGAYVGLIGTVVCLVVLIAILARVVRSPMTESDRWCSAVDQDLDDLEDARRARRWCPLSAVPDIDGRRIARAVNQHRGEAR